MVCESKSPRGKWALPRGKFTGKLNYPCTGGSPCPPRPDHPMSVKANRPAESGHYRGAIGAGVYTATTLFSFGGLAGFCSTLIGFGRSC